MWIEREGTGEPVVIAGGGPGKGHAHYHPWFSALAERFEVVYFDYIGTGRSDRLANRGDYSIRRYADQIEAVRLCLGVQRIAVIGVSFGGMPALDYAQRHPGAVKRLVLSNAQISARTWQERNIDVVNEALRVHFPERWRTLTAMRDRGVRSLDAHYQELFAELLEHLEWSEAQHPQLEGDDFNAPNLEVYAGIVGEDPEWEVTGTMAGFEPDLALVSAPALVVTGRWDRMTTPAFAQELAPRLPDAELAVIEHSAHRPWAERPRDYFERVASFLA